LLGLKISPTLKTNRIVISLLERKMKMLQFQAKNLRLMMLMMTNWIPTLRKTKKIRQKKGNHMNSKMKAMVMMLKTRKTSDD